MVIVLVGEGWYAYKMPRVKTMSSMAFWRAGRCSELMTGMGMVKMVKSVTTLTPAMMYQMVPWLRQKPFTSGFQKASTGMQDKGSKKHRVIPQQIRKPRQKRMIFRRAVLEKMRRYCSRIEILVRQTATLYTTMEL